MRPDPPPPVDMSPEAIAERIATVGQLYRVCMSLMQARPVDEERSVTSPSAPVDGAPPRGPPSPGPGALCRP